MISRCRLTVVKALCNLQFHCSWTHETYTLTFVLSFAYSSRLYGRGGRLRLFLLPTTERVKILLFEERLRNMHLYGDGEIQCKRTIKFPDKKRWIVHVLSEIYLIDILIVQFYAYFQLTILWNFLLSPNHFVTTQKFYAKSNNTHFIVVEQ